MAVISQITLPSGTTYDLKDADARTRLTTVETRIAGLASALYWIGVTSTQLTDGSTTNPITVNGSSVTANTGGVAQVSGTDEEYCWDGSAWQLLGTNTTPTGLGDLAYADTASASYTPAGSVSGTVSGTAVTVGSTTVNEVTNAGSMPSYSVNDEILTITAGTTPTVSSKTVGASGSATVTQGTFSANLTGTAATITVSPDTP